MSEDSDPHGHEHGWFDDHCHLEDGPDGDRDVAAARAAGVAGMITIGTDLEHSRAAVAVARRHPNVWATVGLHPHDATNGLEGIADLLAEPEVVAVGECGLDYFYEHSPAAVQREVFAAQIGLAHTHHKTLVVHTRDAWPDTLEILDREGWPARTVIHCFTGGPDEATACLERGAYLSFSGIVTFPKAPDVHAAAAVTPLDRTLVETDSPFLAPVPHRGKRNEPAHVAIVGARVAELQGVEVDVLRAATWRNAHEVYALR